MEVLFIIFIILVVIGIGFLIAFLVINHKNLELSINEIANQIPGLVISKSTKKPFGYKFTYQGQDIYVSIFTVPNKGTITINSRYVWQIVDNGTKMRTVEGVKPFMDTHVKNKIALLTPSIENVRRWVNESEMDFIDGKMDIYGARVAGIKDYQSIKDALDACVAPVEKPKTKME